MAVGFRARRALRRLVGVRAGATLGFGAGFDALRVALVAFGALAFDFAARAAAIRAANAFFWAAVTA